MELLRLCPFRNCKTWCILYLKKYIYIIKEECLTLPCFQDKVHKQKSKLKKGKYSAALGWQLKFTSKELLYCWNVLVFSLHQGWLHLYCHCTWWLCSPLTVVDDILPTMQRHHINLQCWQIWLQFEINQTLKIAVVEFCWKPRIKDCCCILTN